MTWLNYFSHKYTRSFSLACMGVASLGIGIKITYWTYMDWLPKFDYFDGFSLIIIGFVLFIFTAHVLGFKVRGE